MKVIFSPGTKLGELTLIGRVRSGRKTPVYRKKSWRCRCTCGVELTVPEWYLQRPGNPKRSCGHRDISLKTQYNREYRIWCMIHQRCLFSHHIAYKYYGGRGIKIHPDWLNKDYGGNPDDKGFQRFFEHVGPAPTLGHSIDRIEVNGNYEPGNIRWATAKEQAQNKRPIDREPVPINPEEHVDEEETNDGKSSGS